jgi:AraC-like DNA-binding protein
VAIVDPRAGGALEPEQIERVMTRYPTLPIIVYTALAPDTIRATVELAKQGLQHVVLRGFDDEPRRFRELLERQPAYAMSDAVLATLAPALSELPAPLARAIVRLFESPTCFDEVEDLAAVAGMTRRHLSRWLERVGLAPPRTLVIAARMARAYHYMRDPGHLLEDVARKMGYGSQRLFIRQARELFGLTPTEVREQLQPGELVEMLADVLTSRGAQLALAEVVLDSREVSDGAN